MILSRFEHGDAASFEEVIVSLRHRFGQQNYSEDFHKLLKDPGSLRIWTRRVISRSQFSERVNTISQKVPVKWADIARRKSLLICKTAIELQVDNVFNMDETFILVYQDKVLLLKGPWFQLKKTKRESHWQSQLVFFLHNFSHHSSLILDHLEQI